MKTELILGLAVIIIAAGLTVYFANQGRKVRFAMLEVN